jgi:hypothetical protein
MCVRSTYFLRPLTFLLVHHSFKVPGAKDQYEDFLFYSVCFLCQDLSIVIFLSVNDYFNMSCAFVIAFGEGEGRKGGRERGGECPVENRGKPRLPKVFEPRFSSVQTIGKPRETSGNLGFVTEGNFVLGFGPT